MSLSYTWEKLYAAVDTLAATSGSIQERLGDAYVSQLIRLNPEDLPTRHRQEFSALQERLTREEAIGDEGRVAATTRQMSGEEASSLAHQIVVMYDGVARDYGRTGGVG